MNNSFRRFLLPAIFSIFQSLLILSAQESKSWEITADPGTPYLTTIVPIESGHRSIPFLSRVERIWDESLSGLPYNAFGDIIRFRDNWYCTFREGEIHQNHESGRVRIIRSSDGEAWETVALFESDGGDVRDAKFSITADSQLMVNSSIYFMSPDAPFGRRSVTWLSSDGENWSNIYECNSGINTWRWSVTWHKGVGYSIGYSGKDHSGTLYTTKDGKIWDVLINNFFPGGQGNEATLAFDHDDKAYCLLRDGPGGMAQLGVAKPPYSEWSWSDLGMYGGGPEMIRLKDGRFLAVLRLHEGGLPASDIMPGNSPDRGGRTSLLWIDPEKGVMKEFLTLPSGGRGGHSYAGAFEYDGMIWVSYYSSHENVTKEERPAIYLAKVKLAPGINTSCNTTVKDIDGNIYKTIRIGNQEWMAENLNVSHFRNGDPIPEARDQEWTISGRKGEPAWCALDHNPENANKYGKLYNWYAVADPRGLCPDGWRIPDDKNWRQLIGFLGGEQVAGDKMKSLTGWEDGGKGTNESGFSALPGGFRLHRANRFDKTGGYWWGSEQGLVYISNNYPLYYSKGGGHRYFTSKARGLSVRCIRENIN